MLMKHKVLSFLGEMVIDCLCMLVNTHTRAHAETGLRTCVGSHAWKDTDASSCNTDCYKTVLWGRPPRSAELAPIPRLKEKRDGKKGQGGSSWLILPNRGCLEKSGQTSLTSRNNEHVMGIRGFERIQWINSVQSKLSLSSLQNRRAWPPPSSSANEKPPLTPGNLEQGQAHADGRQICTPITVYYAISVFCDTPGLLVRCQQTNKGILRSLKDACSCACSVILQVLCSKQHFYLFV